MAIDKSISLKQFVHPYQMLIHHYYLQKNERKLFLHGSSDINLQRLWLLKGVCYIHFKLNFLERESLPETFNFRNLLQVTSRNFYQYNERFLFPEQFLFNQKLVCIVHFDLLRDNEVTKIHQETCQEVTKTSCTIVTCEAPLPTYSNIMKLIVGLKHGIHS